MIEHAFAQHLGERRWGKGAEYRVGAKSGLGA
jgi:hypothetical protein